MTVFDYIQSRYYATKFQFIPLIEVINKFGESAKDELNDLRKQGLIKRREGGNGPVIEYLPNNTNNETT